MSEYMWTGGYQWGKGSRLKGDPNAVAAALQAIKDRHGRVGVDGIKDAWRDGDVALRETMGDDAQVLDIGLDHQAYKILGELEYEKVHVHTEEAMPGGRAFQPLARVTGNPENVRVFVETPREALLLNTAYRPPVEQPSAPPPMPQQAPPRLPVEVLRLEDLRPTPQAARPAPMVPDRDMEAWLALCEWREQFGDIPRYRPVVDAMEALD